MPGSGLRAQVLSTRLRAAAKILSNIPRVSLPVWVFCWLGWYEAISVSVLVNR